MTLPRPPLTRSESLHQQIARHVRNDIEAGVLRDGDVLPSTRELAARWDVSVYTVTEAMKVLADDGVIVSKSRSRRVVQAPEQARRTDIRLRNPHVVLIGGYAGSGKTELGRILARETGWPILDKDTLTRPLVETALEALSQSPHDRESDTYLNAVRPREYEALAAATLENVECGTSAIVTAPFIREFGDDEWLRRTQASYEALNATMTLVWMYCDIPTMHTYLRRRGAGRDTAKLTDWPGYTAIIDPNFRPSVPHIVIDNCASSTSLQAQAKTLLDGIIGR